LDGLVSFLQAVKAATRKRTAADKRRVFFFIFADLFYCRHRPERFFEV